MRRRCDRFLGLSITLPICALALFFTAAPARAECTPSEYWCCGDNNTPVSLGGCDHCFWPWSYQQCQYNAGGYAYWAYCGSC